MAASRTEAVKYLQDTPRGVVGGFILSDANGNEVFETHVENYARRSLSGENGFLVQTNHLVDPGMASHNPPWVTHTGTIDRAAFAYLEKNAKKKNELRGSAPSGFAKAQLCTQMAKTSSQRAGAENIAVKEETKSFFK